MAGRVSPNSRSPRRVKSGKFHRGSKDLGPRMSNPQLKSKTDRFSNIVSLFSLFLVPALCYCVCSLCLFIRCGKLAGAKNAEIAAATEQNDAKSTELADLMDKAAKAKEDIEATTNTLDADQKFLDRIQQITADVGNKVYPPRPPGAGVQAPPNERPGTSK